MSITSLRVSNFKSFRDLQVELKDLNVVVGANASGKSNFVQIFRFLKDIQKDGLDNAISLQGGVDYLTNIKMDSEDKLSIRVGFNKTKETEDILKQLILYQEIVYDFSLKFDKTSKKLQNIYDDNIIYEYQVINIGKRTIENNVKDSHSQEIIKAIIVNMNQDDADDFPKLKAIFNDELKKIFSYLKYAQNEIFNNVINLIEGLNIILQSNILGNMFKNQLHNNKQLILEMPQFAILVSLSTPAINPINFSIFDFDPKLPKKATSINTKIDLEEDGSNLVIVLRKILADPDEKQEFLNLLNYALPFIDNIDVENFEPSRQAIIKIKEAYSETYIPSFLISDGTINIIALIIALFFDDSPLIIIEEPERNIHPYLMSRVVELMKEASKHKQIIITTHNPEIVKYADLEDLLFIYRDKEGFSCISRPAEKEAIQTFLSNNIEVHDLYVDNLLGLGA